MSIRLLRAHRSTLCMALWVALAACSPQPEQEAGIPVESSRQAPAQGIELPSFVRLVKEQGATVVNVSAIRTASMPTLPEGDPMLEFFRRFGIIPDPGEPTAASLGSGFIISPDGYILTNAHVVAGTDQITIKLTNKREYPAKVVGADRFTDVALLKIDAKDLQAVRIADVTQLEPGQWVAAIGAPFGFENSVTVGVVSAKGRLLPNESYVPFIQTDVAVNPGNSGGPLFNTNGEVVGVNSQIYSQTGGYMGISFAIPMDIAMNVAQQLREQGKVTRGRIGVQIQEMTLDMAKALGLDTAQGALVAAVEPGGPAAMSGIQPGAVILSINGEPVETTADLARLIAGSRPGTTIEVEVWRDGRKQTVSVKVDELKEGG